MHLVWQQQGMCLRVFIASQFIIVTIIICAEGSPESFLMLLGNWKELLSFRVVCLHICPFVCVMLWFGNLSVCVYVSLSVILSIGLSVYLLLYLLKGFRF